MFKPTVIEEFHVLVSKISFNSGKMFKVLKPLWEMHENYRLGLYTLFYYALQSVWSPWGSHPKPIA